MNVGDLFSDLSFGELRNLSLAGSGNGSIDEEDKPRVVYYARRALTRLFSRFVVKRMFIYLVQSAERQTYAITPAHTEYNPDPDNTEERYLLGSAEDPFVDDLIKVLSARIVPCDEFPDGLDLILNGVSDGISAKLLSHNKITFDEPVAGRTIRLELQLDHAKLPLPVDEDALIEIPPILVEALHVKIAAGIYSSMSGEEQANKSTALEMQFEGLCGLIDVKDLTQGSLIDDAGSIRKWGFK